MMLPLHPPDYNECLINNGNCSQNCRNLIPGYTCFCDDGYELDEDNLTCIGELRFSRYMHVKRFEYSYIVLFGSDINECAENNGGCAENCSNTIGNFSCTCFESGYEVIENHLPCVGKCGSVRKFVYDRNIPSHNAQVSIWKLYLVSVMSQLCLSFMSVKIHIHIHCYPDGIQLCIYSHASVLSSIQISMSAL